MFRTSLANAEMVRGRRRGVSQAGAQMCHITAGLASGFVGPVAPGSQGWILRAQIPLTETRPT